MNNVTDYPLLVFVCSFFMLWLSARIGVSVLSKRRKLYEETRGDFNIISGATLPCSVSSSNSLSRWH
jgi:hypothetical protein